MKGKAMRSHGDGLFGILNTFVLVLFIIVILYPMLFVVIASLSDPVKVYESPLLLWPKGFQLHSYALVLQNNDIWVGYRNTIVYSILGTILSMALTTLGAYPISRNDFKGKTLLTVFFTVTMFFNGGMIPFYMVVQSLGLTNTMWAMIVPGCAAAGAVSVFYLLMMRTFFKTTIPPDLQEAAFIDGCGNFRILFSVVLPLSMPIIAVLTLFYFVGYWNSYFNAMIFTTDRSKFSLQLVLRELLIMREMDSMLTTMTDQNYMKRLMEQEGLKYAVIVVTSLPVLLFYPFVSKYFKQGVMIGAIKG